MKIGVFIGDSAADSGGGYTFVHDILDELRRQAPQTSHRFSVLTTQAAPAQRGELEVISLRPALPKFALRARRRLARDVDRLLGKPMSPFLRPDPLVERILTEAGLDVIWHVQPATWWTQDIPYITTVWDLQHRLQPFFPEVSSAGEFHYRDNIYAPLLQRAALVVAGTEAGSEEIRRFYGVAPDRIRILPHPTPAFALNAPATTRPPSAPAGPYLLYPAQHWPHKNHVNLLEALRLLRTRDGLPLSLVLCGSDKGNGGYVRETVARLGLSEAVRMLGFVSREELVGLYRHAFALCYVTFFGPENLPPLEAFALGCPVVASDVSGAREQLADAALLVDPRKPDDIAAAVRRLHAEPALRAQLIERGAARARRFTGADFVAGMVAWLDDFAAVRRCWPGSIPGS